MGKMGSGYGWILRMAIGGAALLLLDAPRVHAQAAGAAAGASLNRTTIALQRTSHVCNPLGLHAMEEGPPHNFPGASEAIMDLFRPVAPGLVETSIAPGRNPLVPRVFGTDLGVAYEHSDGRLYFHFGDSAFTPIEGFDPAVPQSLNDDVLASTSQTKEPTATRCIDFSIPSLARDAGEFAPITFNGYAKDGGVFLGAGAVPGAGFSTGKFAFAVMPAGQPGICTISETGSNDCAQVGGIEGDVCLPLLAPQFGFCYFGECDLLNPNSPCALRFGSSTLAVRESATNYIAPRVGVHITSPAVLDAYRGHFSVQSTASEVNWKTGNGKVWVIGRDSFWGMPGMSMSPYLLYHPVTAGKLGEPQYFAGMNGNQPIFSPQRTAAQPLYGESKLVNNQSSFGYLPDVDGGTWVMLYGGRVQSVLRPSLEVFVRPVTDAHFYDRNAGIYMRWAKKPYGPWSEPVTIFNPFTAGQGGYCEGMFFDDPEGKTGFTCPASSAAHNARLDRLPASGLAGEYGAALLPRYTKRVGRDGVQIHWLLSTWNPYRVALMKTELSIKCP